MADTVIGIDIGGTQTGVCMGTTDGVIFERVSFATQSEKGAQQTIDNLIAHCKSMQEKHGQDAVAFGVACGNPLDRKAGIIESPPNLPGWDDVPIVEKLAHVFQRPVFLDNDANAGALAEWHWGAGQGTEHMVFLTFGTGMGAGLILNGKIYRGVNTYAGEVGHMRLAKTGPTGYHKPGSFEGFCSGGGIAKLGEYMLRNHWGYTPLAPGLTAKDVGEGAAAGDELSLRILKTSGEYLGRGLAVILDMINPEKILIGSIFGRCEAFIRPEMERMLHEEALPQTLAVCEITRTSFGEEIGNYEGLAVAKDGLEAGI